MKEVKLNKGTVSLPDSWGDLTPGQFLYTVEQLLLLTDGKLEEFRFRLNLLLCYTGYKPRNRDYDAKRGLRFKLLVKRFGYAVKYRCWRLLGRVDSTGYKRIMQASRQKLCYAVPEEPTREVIAFNLVQLADMIRFPLTGGRINLSFLRNPLPEPVSGQLGMKKFDVGIMLVTSFSAGEFLDAVDIASAWRETKKEELLDSLLAIIYPQKAIAYSIEQISRHSRQFKAAGYSLKFGAYLWVCSIAEYFSRHPVYSLLYSGKAKDDAVESVRLGAGEAIIHLSGLGYGSHAEIRSKNLIEFMDIQLVNLKNNISQAIAAGVKPADLCSKTGLSLAQIQMLS